VNQRSRREFLRASAAAAAAALARVELHAAPLVQTRPLDPALAGGTRTALLELGATSGAPLPPFGTMLGAGLDARLFTDLSTLEPDRLVVPNDRFFVRTSCPPSIDAGKPWAIEVGGLVRARRTLPLADLKALVRPFDPCVFECAGNTNPSNFGLLSAAAWDGIPVAAVLDRVQLQRGALRVLVSGVDDFPEPSRTSVPGASWVFSRDDLERTGAFLATAMNGGPLPRDHGFPLRLAVPGWYGCACIKWVNRIELVPDDAPATTQMREFAQRTHQPPDAERARDFIPPEIDLAAMPIRVEKWMVAGRPIYRIVGVMWGGSKPTNALQIRFRTDEPFAAVSDCPLPKTTRTWSLWSHIWRPAAPRRYQIVLRVADPTVRTRRLDMFFYTREVTVDET